MKLLAILIVGDERCADENRTTYPPILYDWKETVKDCLLGWNKKGLTTSNKLETNKEKDTVFISWIFQLLVLKFWGNFINIYI